MESKWKKKKKYWASLCITIKYCLFKLPALMTLLSGSLVNNLLSVLDRHLNVII